MININIFGICVLRDIFNYNKDLSLKKGDKLKFHAFWIYSVKTNEEGFTISLFTVNDGTGGDYIIENI